MSVSVIIPAYNAQNTIERAIMSVLHQTYPPVEVIVVDDASIDKTREVVRNISESEPKIKLIENVVNQGPSASRNNGFKVAIGEWFAIHDADDAWVETRLEKMVEAAARYDANIVADNMLLYDLASDVVTRTGFPIERGIRWINRIDIFEQDVKLGAEFGYGLLQPMIKKKFLENNNLSYIENIRYGEDMIFMAEMLLCQGRAIIIPDPLYIYTTTIGDVSGISSPHSKSVPRFDLIADGIDALKLKYPLAISPEIDRAMTRLASCYRLVHQANLARAVRLKKGLLDYALYLGWRPRVVGQVLKERLARWRSRKRLMAAGPIGKPEGTSNAAWRR